MNYFQSNKFSKYTFEQLCVKSTKLKPFLGIFTVSVFNGFLLQFPFLKSFNLSQFILSTSLLITLFALARLHLRNFADARSSFQISERILWLTVAVGLVGTLLINFGFGQYGLKEKVFLLVTPIVAQAMLASLFIGPQLTILGLSGVCWLFMINPIVPSSILIVSWMAGAMGAFVIHPLKRRSDLLRATRIQAFALAIMSSYLMASKGNEAVSTILETVTWAVVAAVLAVSIFGLGIALVERFFGVISDWSLLELCSPDHPLLRELCLKAPGTYAHSMMVSNLAENASRKIGANPVLTRAMAYFHDIGKIIRPSYFTENQLGPNPHDKLSPKLSASVILAHVSDGIKLGKEHQLPQVILDAIAQHHGTTLMKFFYVRALENGGFTQNNYELEQLFRYSGPKPQCRETAIILLADSIEAASRSLAQNSSEDLEILIRKIIDERLTEGQFDECALTLQDLQLISQSFLSTLTAIFHERVVYIEPENYESTSKLSYANYKFDSSIR